MIYPSNFNMQFSDPENLLILWIDRHNSPNIMQYHPNFAILFKLMASANQPHVAERPFPFTANQEG